MTARIHVLGHIATVSGYHWQCEHSPTEELLNAHLHPLGPSGADPNPDGTQAQRMADQYGGVVLHVDPLPFDSDVVY